MRGGFMKRIYQLVTAALVTLFVPLAMSGSASAAPTCQVGFTGPNSQNMCVSVQTYACSVTNNNVITVANDNTQVAVSGVALSNENTNADGATTGTVTNTNGTVLSVTITNSAQGSQDPQTCTAAVTVPATETPETVTPASTAAPEALPVTSGDKTLTIVALGAGVLGLVALLSASAVVLYRRLRE